jgi:asparagine synthase (glutamine-hydrolysing)
MCGIYGITDKDPNFIQQYIDTCTHRGPDGSKIKTIQGITLGHNLLSIMADPAMSTQPWDTPAGNTLIYNGEIFNYHELKEKYNNEFTDTTGCDTELLAWGLDKYGLDFLDEIDSMHGFAYYKHKEAQLIISRDHVGIKPLYYAEIESGIVFGSELKGLLDKVPGSRKLDRLAASLQSRAGCNPSRNTLFSNIKQLLPGETLVYSVPDRKFIDSKRIYIVPHGNKTFQPKEFRQQVSNAVKRCAIGQRKIGVFLSGGLDSSMVAYELGRLQKINTFTNRMYPEVQGPEDYNSDANAAKVLADREGYTHHEVLITPKEYMSAWEQSINFMEQTNFNPSMAMYFHTNKFMADKGIVVTMAGDMGDELLGGYPKYQKMFFGKHPTSWRELLTMWLGRIKRPKRITQNIMPDEQLLDELEKCFSDKLWNPEDPVGSYMALDCVTQCPAEFFSRNDTYGMAHSMEGRFPLASKKFMQYCLDIHTRYKLTGSETKIISRTAYTGILPKEIINKTKTGWTVPVGFWLTEKMDKHLELFYTKSLGREGLNIVTTSQKSAKMLIPDLIYKDWQKTYRVQDA